MYTRLNNIPVDIEIARDNEKYILYGSQFSMDHGHGGKYLSKEYAMKCYAQFFKIYK